MVFLEEQLSRTQTAERMGSKKSPMTPFAEEKQLTNPK